MSIDLAYQQLQTVYGNGKLAGSWLITGPVGVGKRTLIRRFANFLLTGKPSDEVAFLPDLKWIDRDFTDEEKRDIAKTLASGQTLDEGEQRAKKSEITVDDIRAGIQFLSLTSSGNKWRVLVVDTADDMNENAANALLKLLEEPPAQAAVFLISHNPGRLLPTIRSRCRQVTVAPLSAEELGMELDRKGLSKVHSLLQQSNGSIGKYLNLHENNGEEIQDSIDAIFRSPQDADMIFELAGMLAKDEAKLKVAHDLLLGRLLQRVKSENTKNLDCYLNLWDDINQQIRDMFNLYLDKKTVLANIFFKINELTQC